MEEADESAYWIEVITEGGIIRKDLVEPLHREANEIVAIMTTSRKTAERSCEKNAKRREP
ncbi:MAG: hypothetical protein QME60_02115 [Verrucomicrobiota bacterium]|nr:hypothetical protein [Verrucomicrobiota bacterium]